MSNSTEIAELLRSIEEIKKENNKTSFNEKATLILQIITVVFVMIKPLWYYWVDAKYRKRKKNKNKVEQNETNLPLSYMNNDNMENNYESESEEINSGQTLNNRNNNSCSNNNSNAGNATVINLGLPGLYATQPILDTNHEYIGKDSKSRRQSLEVCNSEKEPKRSKKKRSYQSSTEEESDSESNTV